MDLMKGGGMPLKPLSEGPYAHIFEKFERDHSEEARNAMFDILADWLRLRLGSWISWKARSYGWGYEDLSDLVLSDLFYALLESADYFSSVASIEAALITSAMNKARDIVRKKRWFSPPPEEAEKFEMLRDSVPDSGYDAIGEAIAEELKDEILSILSDKNSKSALIAQMRFFCGYSSKEICIQTGIPIGTITSEVSRMRSILAARMHIAW